MLEITYRLNDWRNGIGSVAIDAVKLYIDQCNEFWTEIPTQDGMGVNRVPDTAAISKWAVDVTTYRNNGQTAPFLWEDWDEIKSSGKVRGFLPVPRVTSNVFLNQGAFCHCILLYTLGYAHIVKFRDVSPVDVKDRPYGAFLMVIQAVRHFKTDSPGSEIIIF
jgi:hypothetical protein